MGSSSWWAPPLWCEEVLRDYPPPVSAEERMRLVVGLARHNVERGTGGPFGAAVFERRSGALVSIGVNAVVRLRNACLHAEVVALVNAQAAVGSHLLIDSPRAAYELVSSSEPCAMCLGAIHWCRIGSVIWAAPRENAEALGFDEGPAPEPFVEHLRARGVSVTQGPLADLAARVVASYKQAGGQLY